MPTPSYATLAAGVTASSLTSVGVLATPHMTGPIVDSGDVTISTLVSRVIPGATSLSFRNNANTFDNLIITNAGAVTVRAGITATTYAFAGGGAITGIATGWAAPTGTLDRTTFVTSAALSVIAQHLGALITDLMNNGVIKT